MGGGGGARRWSLSACGTGKNGLVHAAHGATHGVGTCRRALVVLSWAGTCCAGVVVVQIATMRVAVVTVFESFDQRGGVTGADTISATICAATAATIRVLVATFVAYATAVRSLVATVVATTTTVVAREEVPAK